jgi:hypothetical protein
VKITEKTYEEFPHLKGNEKIFEEATKIIVDGLAEAKSQISQSQKMQEIKQEPVQQKQETTTSLSTS